MSQQMHPIHMEPGYLTDKPEEGGSGRHIAAVVTILVIFMVCVLCAFRMGGLAPTFNGEVNVAKLAEEPDAYTLDKADGAAYVIVAKNLDKTAAKNVCFSVVFNFRGFDTMGESFILIAALSGSLCILRYPKVKKAKKKEKEVQPDE